MQPKLGLRPPSSNSKLKAAPETAPGSRGTTTMIHSRPSSNSKLQAAPGSPGTTMTIQVGSRDGEAESAAAAPRTEIAGPNSVCLPAPVTPFSWPSSASVAPASELLYPKALPYSNIVLYSSRSSRRQSYVLPSGIAQSSTAPVQAKRWQKMAPKSSQDTHTQP